VTTGNKVFLLILLVIALGVGGFFGIRYLVRQGELSAFTNRLAEYTAPPQKEAQTEPNPQGGPPFANPQRGYVKGKVIPVDLANQKIDWFYYDLPDDLKARTPEQVGTVVWLEWGERKVGQYGTSGGGAFVRTCNVTVIDHAQRAIVGRHYIEGGPPPTTSRRGASQYGSYPTEGIVNYLRGLPRR
jgi:hypothetical protein